MLGVLGTKFERYVHEKENFFWVCDKKHKANIFSLSTARPFNQFNFNQIYKKSQGKYVPVEMNIQDEKVRIFLLFEKRVSLPKFQGLTDRKVS